MRLQPSASSLGSFSLAVLALAAAAPACRVVLGTNDLVVTVAVSRTELPADGPVGVSVTAVNTGDRRIVWGQGSSSCQLGAVVRVDGVDRRIDLRGCTADLVPQGLDPGRSRTEEWPWSIEYFGGTSLVPLPPGEYEVYGLAGDRARSRAVRIRVADLP